MIVKNRSMHNPTLNRKLIFLFIFLLFFIGVTKANAFLRPLNPVMDYVPQNLGIYDTYYENFKEPDCRVCHGASTAERHHNTRPALRDNCKFCHKDASLATVPEMDCKLCHIDGGPVGDFGNQHHKSDIAASDQCNQCHLYIVETYTVEPPSHQPTSATPTPYHCGNCHWPSGNYPHRPPYLEDWQSWEGIPKPTYTNGIGDPQPIEAYGPVMNGSLNGKYYLPADGTHHKIAGRVSTTKCYTCHAPSPSGTPDWNPNNPFLIRYCEKCHSMDSLHGNPEHVTTNWIYRIDGVANRTLTAIDKCVACHGATVPSEPPPPVVDIPVIDRLESNFGPPGIDVDIIPAEGTCWNEDPLYGKCSFGLKMDGDAVKVGQMDVEGNLNWVDAPVNTWSEQRIQIKIPTQVSQPGNARVKVNKKDIGASPFKVFNVRPSPVIHSLTPAVGNWDQVVDVGGEGFGIKKEKVYKSGYGYSTYVELSATTDQYRVVIYKDTDAATTGKQWDQNKIKVKLINLINTNTGSQLTEQDLYIGCWNMTVITDYFKDDGDGKYNYGITGLDTPTNPQGSGSGDELLQRSISAPVCFTVTKDTYINSISPNPVRYADKATISGSNFGPTRGTSVVKVWDMGMTNYKIASIRSWNNTKINFTVPIFGLDPNNYPLNKLVQVIVPGKPGSNYYPITIIAR